MRLCQAAARVLWLAGLCLAALAAQAHRMPGGEGVLRVQGREAFLQLALPLAALGWPQGLHPADLAQQQQGLARALRELVQLEADGGSGELVHEQLQLQQADGAHAQDGLAADHVLLQRRVRWAADVTQLQLSVTAMRETDGALSVLALHGARKELAVFGAERQRHRFFRGPLATAQAFVGTGMAHILLGFDHLLFLLALLLGAATWRRWLGLTGSFTLAHSLTLCLSALGWLIVPADVVEPLIAASIVWLALLNLRTAAQPPAPARLGLVFGCGLLHGLGFASALEEWGLDGAQRGASLLGFNLGVELGQLLFVAVVLLCLRVIAAGPWRRAAALLPPLLSGLAALLGLGLLISRLA